MTSLPVPIASGGSVSYPPVAAAETLSVPRRTGRARKYVVLFAILSLAMLYAGFHAYVAWRLTHPDVAPLASNPMLAKNLAYEDVIFPSADGKTMVDGWWIPAGGSRQSVVLSHGYGANREEYWVPMYDLAELLHGLGYNVLMFDYGFASRNNRLPATGGILESQQLLGAIEYARNQGSLELIVWGFSMGAGTALQAALQNAPVDAMILDSTFLPNDETLVYNLSQIPFYIPEYPTLSLVKWFFPFVSGASLEQVPSAQAQGTPFDFPILVVHGTKDSKAPVDLAMNVASAQTHPQTQLWIVQGAIHEMIFRTHHKEYVNRVTAFLGEVHAATAAKLFGTPGQSV